MSEAYTVLTIAVFVGCLAFLSISAANSIEEIQNVNGLNEFENFEPPNVTINLDSYTSRDSIVEEDGVYKWDGTTNDRGSNYGYVRYDISNIDEAISVELRSFLFSQMVVVFENSTGSIVRSRSVIASPQRFNISEIEAETGESLSVMEFRLSDTDHELRGLDVVVPGSGWLNRAENLFNVFTGLSSNTAWFNLLVVIPISFVATYILVKIAAQIVPL